MPRLLGASMFVLGVVFATPLFVPLGNPLTAASMVALGLAVLEEDGVLAVVGVAGTVATVVLHGVFFWLVWKGGRALIGGAR